MRNMWMALLGAAALLGSGQALAATAPGAKAPVPITYKVKSGDTLSSLAGRDWRRVCQLNGLTNCNKLKVGQKIRLLAPPPAARPKAKVSPKKTALPVRPVPSITAPGYTPWVNVGAAPLINCGKRSREAINEEAWNLLGLSAEEKQELREKMASGDFKDETLAVGQKFEKVAFCHRGKVAFKDNMIAAWSQKETITAQVFVLSSGRELHYVKKCGNWVVTTRPPPPPPAPPPPEPPPPEEPPPPPLPPAPPEEKRWCKDIEPKLVVGQEHEFEQNGDASHSNFLAGAIYCTWKGELLGEPGTHGVGAGVQASTWNGTVNSGDGHYKGYFAAAGPAYMFAADEGWDFEVKAPMLGVLHEEFEQGAYQSERDFVMLGAGATYNDYRREMSGKKVLPKTQVFGQLGIPLSGDAEHSWEGKPIQDTSALGDLDLYAQAGVRQYLYAGKVVRPYVQGGVFAELPGSTTGSLRLGVADRYEICGVGIGYDFDLKNGGDPHPAWGWWCDPVRGFRVARASHRASQIEPVPGPEAAQPTSTMLPSDSDRRTHQEVQTEPDF